MNSPVQKISCALLAATAALMCIVAPGCKSDGGSQELLERELRCQEDRIFQLEDDLDDMCFALEASRRENQTIKLEKSGGDKGAGTPSATVAPTVEAPSVEAPALEPPKFEFVPKSKTDEPLDEAPKFQDGPLDEAPPFEAPKSTTPSADHGEPGLLLRQAAKRTELTGDGRQIVRLALNRQLTGSWNPDGKHGDEGIFVAFEPRDAQKKLVAAVGPVSIVVLDPAQTGAAARVARWDFTTDEAALHFRKGPLGNGLQFELPWPSNPPQSRDLRLFVRMETPDGRKVEADTKVHIDLYDGWAAKPVSKEEPVVAESIVPEPRPASRVVAKPKRSRRPGWAPNR